MFVSLQHFKIGLLFASFRNFVQDRQSPPPYLAFSVISSN